MFQNAYTFLSTLSLRRATWGGQTYTKETNISIHALLAESDASLRDIFSSVPVFLSTLSLRRATTVTARIIDPTYDFYPRSPCGERHSDPVTDKAWALISIHALLAESDLRPCFSRSFLSNFYPRSPCGERRGGQASASARTGISIHALLAESDTG